MFWKKKKVKVRFCENCGKRVPLRRKKTNFCSYCGKKLFPKCYCWVLKKANNCGHPHCPQSSGFVEEIKNS